MIKSYLLMLLSVIVASVSQVLLKISANIIYDNHIKEYLNIYVIIGYALMVASTLLVILAYRELDYKIGSVIDSLGYLIMMFLGSVFFNEKITKNKILGNLLIIIGVVLFCL